MTLIPQEGMTHRACSDQASRDHRHLSWEVRPSWVPGAPKNESPTSSLMPGVASALALSGKAGRSGWCSKFPWGGGGALGIGFWGGREPHGGPGLPGNPHGVRSHHLEKEPVLGWPPAGEEGPGPHRAEGAGGSEAKKGWCRGPRGPQWKQPGPSPLPSTAPASGTPRPAIARSSAPCPSSPLCPV